MSIHKLTAGSGYDYLTRQVAAFDATEKGHVGLASYYTERGETPGVWVGSGMAGIDGLAAGDPVTAEQMQALFGSGHHPLAAQRQHDLAGPDLTGADYENIARLGAPFKVFEHDVSPFRVEVAKRFAAVNGAAGLPGDWPVPADQRARVRSEVGVAFFEAAYDRPPVDARELAGHIAKLSRPQTTAVAGFDLTFSPVKSVSTLWALADPPTAAGVERAHQAALGDALRFLERHALYSREGTNGVRQVDVRGLVATAFTHRDSRAGDPDLHTHVAVANKVQTLDGRWLAVDGRILFKATVAASEVYNTRLEQHLQATLGVRFLERPSLERGKRSVREMVGVDPGLAASWSSRRVDIDIRRAELAAAFQRDHGRPPTPVEAVRLAQQATLETRQAKHQPRTLAEQRATWRAQAERLLGGPGAVQAMLAAATHPLSGPRVVLDVAWVDQAAGRLVAAMESRRATWQVWHVRAEAQRLVRAADVPVTASGPLVEALVTAAAARSVILARPDDISDPPVLRRRDGASVYAVAGADLHTSAAVLAAEQRLVDTAGRGDGRRVDPTAVELALLELTANGVTLNPGQADLVRAMADSGSRLQLAIAPAGTGKTTALAALTAAWTGSGGAVVGLAPSAAAAAVLQDHTGGADTLAKLTWSLTHPDQPKPDWVTGVGPDTLVVIDEAGMADTRSLDRAVSYIVGRGGSVRLLGDDQQLAAIGAGGVLRDIAETHGAVRLTELMRFTDPAEGQASLALRDGRPEALGFYLDHQRVHVGDHTTMTERVFDAWRADRDAGHDTVMIAPTRDQVAELNRQARQHRLDTPPATQPTSRTADPGRSVALVDGNHATVGELVITRRNDRRLRTTATDWVKNGDRWTVQTVTADGGMTVQHTGSRRTVRLPAGYVAEAVELGYAVTVHCAQGVSVDTMHGLADPTMSRQQLYTMATRGRHSNHLYLPVVGDGDPHTVMNPEVTHPATATDLLEQVLACDDAQSSATTRQHDLLDPALRLGDAADRYVDALHVAAEHLIGTDQIQILEATVEQALPGLTGQPAWPALRAHLLLIAAHGRDPYAALTDAAAERELDTADDPAAVLDWRLDATGLRGGSPGPLPWLPSIPTLLADHPAWAGYLTQRSDQVSTLADKIGDHANPDTGDRSNSPAWLAGLGRRLPASVVADIEVWRAATHVDPDDLRPIGPIRLPKAMARWQRRIDTLLADHDPALQEWRPIFTTVPHLLDDTFASHLANRLAALTRAGIDARQLLDQALNEPRPLPDDHPAGALWWRISRHTSPAVTAAAGTGYSQTAPWTDQLAAILGAAEAADLQASRWWPALVTVIDHALQHGWRLNTLLQPPHPTTAATDRDDPCQQLVWRTSILLDQTRDHDAPDPDEPDDNPPPDDRWAGLPPNRQPTRSADPTATDQDAAAPADPAPAWSVLPDEPNRLDPNRFLRPGLAVAALLRSLAGPLPPPIDTDRHPRTDPAITERQPPVTRDRLLEINQLTHAYYRGQLPGSWGQAHLQQRFHSDLVDHPDYQPGQAPAGWNHLVTHLRAHGVTDTEMLAAGVVTAASTGRLIDRFRDRLVFPIIDHGEILGFIGRRHPDLPSGHPSPKYLNTGNTALFCKGGQLFGVLPRHLTAGGIPVLVEGPIDAVAVTVATHGRYVGVAALGTSLTDRQAAQLAHLGPDLVVATDGDLAGQVAAERHYWKLTPYGIDPLHALLPTGHDPASIYTAGGPHPLTTALDAAQPLARTLTDERAAHLTGDHALHEAVQVVAARPPDRWDDDIAHLAHQLDRPDTDIVRSLLAAARAWNSDPQQQAADAARRIGQTKQRLTAAADQFWTGLADHLDPRLREQPDWPLLVETLRTADAHGHNVTAACLNNATTITTSPDPARDLRYQLVAQFGLTIATHPDVEHRDNGRRDPKEPGRPPSTPRDRRHAEPIRPPTTSTPTPWGRR